MRSVQIGLCSFFCFFYRYFPWQTLTIHMIAGNGEGNIIYLVFHFYPLTNIHLVHRDFHHFFLIYLFVIARLIADEVCSPWICILFAFSLMQLSRSYWLSHFKVTLRGYKLIWNYHPSITKRTAYPTEINTPSHHCLSITPTRLPKCVKNEGSFLPEIWRRISKSIFTVLK